MKSSEMLTLAAAIYLAPHLSRRIGLSFFAVLCVASFIFDHYGD